MRIKLWQKLRRPAKQKPIRSLRQSDHLEYQPLVRRDSLIMYSNFNGKNPKKTILR